MPSVEVISGDNYTLPTCNVSYIGHTFNGWKQNNSLIATSSIVVEEDITLTADWN